MSAVSFEAFGALAASDFPDTVKAGRHVFQAEAEGRIAYNIASRLELSKDDDLLDIGCGTGAITIPLVSQVKNLDVIDHAKVVEALLARAPETDAIYPYMGDFLSFRVPRYFDKVLIYSVVHYLTDEAEVLEFLRKAYGLLRPGGKMLVGDIPNVDRKRRFESSQFGAAFSKAWASRENGGNEFFDAIEADENRVAFDDAMIRRLIKDLGLRGRDYRVMAQPSAMPFGHTREDILITRPG